MNELKSDHIGDLGEDEVRLFFRWWAWYPRKDEKDQGIDFSIEIPGDASGIRRRFLVQVKTCNPMTELKSGDWSIAIDKGALRKYAATREPVFVVACDLPTKRLRAVHIQRYLVDISEPLTDNGELVIRFPAARELDRSDKDSFRRYVDAAWTAQDAVHHSPTTAIAHMESELSQLDHRLKLDVVATRDGYQMSISANEPVEFNFAVKPSSVEDALSLERMIKYGAPSSVRYDELEVSNPLLNRAISSRGGVMEIGSADAVRVSLRLGRIRQKKKKRNTLQPLITMRAEVTRGSHGNTVRSIDDEVPFSIYMRIDHLNHCAEVDFAIADQPLVGLPVASLPYVEKLYEMFEIGEQGELGLQMMRGDQPALPPLRLHMSDQEMGATLMRHMGNYVGQFFALMVVARRRQLDLRWRPIKETTNSERHSWETALKLIDRRDVSLNTPGEFTVTTNTSEPFDVHSDATGKFFVIKGGSYTVEGWGEMLCSLPVDVCLHGYEMVRLDKDVNHMSVRPGANADAVMRIAMPSPAYSRKPKQRSK